jgi:nucleotide-binding universal stress UspA family protein
MKRILFPTDFSSASLNAFVYALHLARKFHAKIITLHVTQQPVPAIYDLLPALDNYGGDDWANLEDYKTEVQKLRQIADANHASHINLSHVLKTGSTAEMILEVSDREDVNYIVMGTTGANGTSQMLIGSNAEKVMNESDTMVFAVPEKCHYKPISKILFLTQFKKRHQESLNKVVQFAEYFGAHVDALWITPDPDIEKESILAEWKQIFSEADVDFRILAGRDPEHDIFDFIASHHIDMVAMTVKHKGFLDKLLFESMARKMAFHSQVPILAIKHD